MVVLHLPQEEHPLAITIITTTIITMGSRSYIYFVKENKSFFILSSFSHFPETSSFPHPCQQVSCFRMLYPNDENWSSGSALPCNIQFNNISAIKSVHTNDSSCKKKKELWGIILQTLIFYVDEILFLFIIIIKSHLWLHFLVWWAQ